MKHSQPSLSVRIRLALDLFELDVEFSTTSQVTGVFGASGAGKSSLLQSVAGTRGGVRGRIGLGDALWLDSDSGAWVPPEGRDIGYVPQEGLLFPNQDVLGNLLAGAARARRRRHSVEDTLRSVCRLLELDSLLEREVSTLSGGERQRVALGRAMCSGPRLLLLDEPLASLDLPLRRRILPFLHRVREEFEIPMLLVSHDPTEVQALCEDVVVLSRGRILASGPARRVLTDPKVFPLAREEGFQNILPGRLKSIGPISEVQLGSSGLSLFTPPAKGRPGDRLLVGVPAREIIVAAQMPLQLSAQNLLPARIEGVDQGAEATLVTASLGAGIPDLAVEVTERACRQLRLEPGREVFLIIKTVSCTLFESDGSSSPNPLSV